MRNVENWEIVRAYYGNPDDPDSVKAARDNRSVIKAVFRRHGLEDDGDAHALNATWRCLRFHQEGRQKFTSSLHRFAYWECKEAQRERTRKRCRPFSPLPLDISYTPHTNLDEWMETLPERERRLIHLHFVKGFTAKEIAKEDKTEPGLVQAQIDGAVESLRKVVQDG